MSFQAELLPDHHWWVQGRSLVLRKLLERYPAPGPSLDVGAGNGFWAETAPPEAAPRWLVEPDVALLSELRRRGLGQETVRARLPGPLPFRDGAFRLVTCLDVLEHEEDDHRSVAELSRITAKGGRLLFTVPANPRLWSSWDEYSGHKRRYTRTSLQNLMLSEGLKILVLAPLVVTLYPIAWAGRRLNIQGTRRPGRALNLLLAKALAWEGSMITTWPRFVRGLSWVCLAENARPTGNFGSSANEGPAGPANN